MQEKLYDIYIIKNIINDKIYIGRSCQYEKRKERHLKELRQGIHHSFLLQEDWNNYQESSFIFYREIQNIKEDESKAIEEYLISLNYEESYNVSKNSTFGDIISYHPKKEEIIQKIKNTLKNFHSNLTIEERKLKYGNLGEKNGMYGTKHSEESKLKMSNSRKGKYSGKDNHRYGKKNSKETRQKISEANKGKQKGEKNPFYGKKHSKENKEKLSKKSKERMKLKLPSTAKKVLIEGIEYRSIGEAARHFNVKNGTIINRIKSKNEKYVNYFYVDELKNDKSDPSN